MCGCTAGPSVPDAEPLSQFSGSSDKCGVAQSGTQASLSCLPGQAFHCRLGRGLIMPLLGIHAQGLMVS